MLFQFQLGAIKSAIPHFHRANLQQFQFQLGAIKSVAGVYL